MGLNSLDCQQIANRMNQQFVLYIVDFWTICTVKFKICTVDCTFYIVDFWTIYTVKFEMGISKLEYSLIRPVWFVTLKRSTTNAIWFMSVV